jgi:hypothetical protein
MSSLAFSAAYSASENLSSSPGSNVSVSAAGAGAFSVPEDCADGTEAEARIFAWRLFSWGDCRGMR